MNLPWQYLPKQSIHRLMVNPDAPTIYDPAHYRPENSVGCLMRLILSRMAHGIDT